MRRSDWMSTFWSAFVYDWRWYDFVCVAAIVVWLFTGCALWEMSQKPSGKPGCPNRSVWSDSAQKCVTK